MAEGEEAVQEVAEELLALTAAGERGGIEAEDLGVVCPLLAHQLAAPYPRGCCIHSWLMAACAYEVLRKDI